MMTINERNTVSRKYRLSRRKVRNKDSGSTCLRDFAFFILIRFAWNQFCCFQYSFVIKRAINVM